MNATETMHGTFKSWLEENRPIVPMFRHLIDRKGLRLTRDEQGSPFFQYDSSLLDRTFADRFTRIFQLYGFQLAVGIEIWNTASLFHDGPKVFRPTEEECFALEEIELRIPMSAYSQPFPCFVIEFPDAYCQSKQTEGIGLEAIDRKKIIPYQPLAQIIYHHRDLGVLTITSLTRGTKSGLSLCGILGSLDSKTLEEDIQKKLLCPLDSSNEETMVQQRCTRVALNASLLLMDRGFRRSSSTNESLLQRIEERLRKKVRPEIQEKNQVDRSVVPVIYEFEQYTNIRRLVGSHDAAESTPTGRKVRPHWRSSHWRMARVGKGRQETRRTLIPHIFVNERYFNGIPSNTVVFQE